MNSKFEFLNINDKRTLIVRILISQKNIINYQNDIDWNFAYRIDSSSPKQVVSRGENLQQRFVQTKRVCRHRAPSDQTFTTLQTDSSCNAYFVVVMPW